MLWWLSFCDPDKPPGEQFLGVAIVEAPGAGSKERATVARALYGAMQEAWRQGCNPGGEVESLEIPESNHAEVRPYLNRLMQKDELSRLGWI